MKESCDVVQDLLPLYMDGVCSGASGKLVREHLEECEKCREMFRLLARDTYAQRAMADEEAVLKKTSLSLNRRAVNNALGIFSIVGFWLLYFWQQGYAEIGDYRYFSYTFHEICSLGLILAPGATLIWLTVLLVKSKKQKTWRKNAAMILILLVLAAGQTAWFASLRGQWSTSTWTQILEIPDDYHIVIERGEGEYVTLETSMQVTKLLELDGTVYQICYEWNEREPDVGRVWYIEYAHEAYPD